MSGTLVHSAIANFMACTPDECIHKSIHNIHASTPAEIKTDPGAVDRRSKGIQRLWQQWRGCDTDQADQHEGSSNNKLRGTIQAVHITKRRDGQLMGCAYVRFECNELLARSMFQENGNQLVGKAVVVDWQPELPKKRFRQWRCW